MTFVIVKEYEDDDKFIKLPLEDNRLPRITVKEAYSAYEGLFYQLDGMINAVGLLSCDDTLKEPFFKEPEGGWVGKEFFVKKESRPLMPISADSWPSTQFEQDFMHKLDWVNTYLFFIEENGLKSCVVALTPHYLVTFRHGNHLNYTKDLTVVRVVSLSCEKQYDATIVHICEEEDYVILKSNEKVVNRECPLQECDVMKRFVVCGFGKGFPELTFIRGTVYSTHPFVYENNGKSFGPFVYGTAKTSPGDSGAACFGTCGLMAINLGTTIMPLKHHNEAISKAAIFSPNNYMITAVHIRAEVAKLETKKFPKRPYHEISIEGVGKFEF